MYGYFFRQKNPPYMYVLIRHLYVYLKLLVFKPRGGGKWGPHGAPTPHSPRGGGLSLKKPRGGGFDQKKPRGFMGDLCPFYNFLRLFLIKSQKKMK